MDGWMDTKIPTIYPLSFLHPSILQAANNMAPKRQKRTQSQRQLATLSII